MVTRDQATIEQLLLQPGTTLSQRMALAIEHYIAGTNPERQHKVRQELPFLVQFLPTIALYHKHAPSMIHANPGIPHGGFTEYPKSLIYDRIPDEFRIHTVDFLQDDLPLLDDVLKTIHDYHLQRPLMLKADKGERGVGIYYINDQDALEEHRRHLESGKISWCPSSIQEFINMKEEYCLQFYHYVDQNGNEQWESGGLTLRDIPSVTGDGKHTVRELIQQLGLDLSHQQNITQKMTLNEKDTLDMVPLVGERVTIVRTASLDYGTVYVPQRLDHEQEQKLLSLIQQLLRNADTNIVCVGRFDLKADSLNHLLDGKCKVIELNAGGGMPTDVYDEHLPIHKKYKFLEKHFDLMKSIAMYNKPQYSWFDMLKGYGGLLSVSARSLQKKGITASSPQSKQIATIIRYIRKLLHRMRWKRKKKQLLSLFGR